jgi:D-arginine dehydrogenase
VTDFVVIGGGIAGVSAAAHLAPHGSVILLETERSLAFHTTGRSAALFILNYGSQGFRPLTKASQAFLENPPEGMVDAPLLTDRGLLWLATSDQLPGLFQIATDSAAVGEPASMLDADEVVDLVPVVRRDVVAGGLFEPSAKDIDVAGLHQAFVRIIRSHGGEIRTHSQVTDLQRIGVGWSVRTGSDILGCDVVVNASGAWGDEVAALAHIDQVGLQPMRRTAFMVPGDQAFSEWPMVVDADQEFYFKADGSQILCSLGEEEPSAPTDPKPRIEDVALAIDRINRATTLGVRTVSSEWTGLRTFAPDRELVVGEEPSAPGFYWLVGQGGTGIQTAPAYGALLASLVVGEDLPSELASAGVDPSITDPSRFRI